MTHQEFIEKAYAAYEKEVFSNSRIDYNIFIVWSCKTANNSKLIMADNVTNIICEATLIGHKGLVVYDFYKKDKHLECSAV